MKRAATALTLLLVACGVDSASVGAPTTGSTSHGAALSTRVELTFNADYTTTVSQPLTAGATVHVTYDASRLPDCRGTTNGTNPAWSIGGFWRVGSAASGTLDVGGLGFGTQSQPEFVVPSEGTLELWFQVTNAWGCTAWDSAYGQNYSFPVGAAPPVIHFKSGWVTAIDGELKGAPRIALDYDASRLPTCRATYNGGPAWAIQASWNFDGGNGHNGDVTNGPTVVEVPSDANDLAVWFFNSDENGCTAYDSAYGQNYHFAVH